jgi:hypothetical protein
MADQVRLLTPVEPDQLRPFLTGLVRQMEQLLEYPGVPVPAGMPPELAPGFYQALAPFLAGWTQEHQAALPRRLVKRAVALSAQLEARVSVQH